MQNDIHCIKQNYNIIFKLSRQNKVTLVHSSYGKMLKCYLFTHCVCAFANVF